MPYPIVATPEWRGARRTPRLRLLDRAGWLFDSPEYDSGLGSNPTPLGARVGTKARLGGAGPRTGFWREGAPMSLVSPSRTTAMVHQLEVPIVLAPGDQVEVEVSAPHRPADDEGLPSTNVGVSLAGVLEATYPRDDATGEP